MSDDIRADFDRIIDAVNRMSQVEHLRDMVREARDVAKHECGNCNHWMKSRQCPREWNDNGRQRGPSMTGSPCSKFSMSDSTIHTQRDKIEAAIAFARAHDLPLPPNFNADRNAA